MALLILAFLTISSAVSASFTHSPAGAVAPIRRYNTYKDTGPPPLSPFPTIQFAMELQQKTPFKKENLLLDISLEYSWMPCAEPTFASKTFTTLSCKTPLCKQAAGTCTTCSRSIFPGCRNKRRVCDVPLKTSNSSKSNTHVALDRLAIPSIGGNITVAIAPRFAFACAPVEMLAGFPSAISGGAGLGRGAISLPMQLSSSFRFGHKFAVCLPGAQSPGMAFFGNASYVFRGTGIDLSQRLRYVPLISNLRFPNLYMIDVNSIWVDERPVDFEGKKLRGAVVSSTVRYTTLEKSIYRAVRDAFVKASAARKIARVASVGPFEACFSTRNVQTLVVGPRVPTVDLILHNNRTTWSISGFNLMVHPRKDVMCLALAEGGEDLVASVVIGSHQLEDNLVEFDLDASRLGFSSSLLGLRASCAAFNFSFH